MKNQLKVLESTIEIGLEKPLKLLHITDTHLAFDDPGKDSGRQRHFEGEHKGCIADYYFQAVDYARKNGLLIVNTGDMLDFLSDANFAFTDKHLKDADCIYAAGNHDFCHCVGEAKEDAEYKRNNMKITAPHFNTNLLFDSRVTGGVNFVTLDNSYYLISDGQIDMLRAEAARGYPIVLCVHVPFFTQALAKSVYGEGNDCAYLVAAPEEHLKNYSEHRRSQQKPDEATLRAVTYIKSEPLIKAVIAGHLHLNFDGTLDNGIPQLVTHGTYAGYVREITIV